MRIGKYAFLFVLLALAFAGCSSSEAPAEPAATDASAGAASTEPQAAPGEGGPEATAQGGTLEANPGYNGGK